MAFARNGYGQVEPNQLSAQKTGQIYASLPLDATVKVLQNGEFMYYDYSQKKVTADTQVSGQEPMLVFNEIKLYEPFWRTSYKDFAMIRVGDNYVTSKLATAGYGDGSTTPGVAANPAHPDYPYRMDGIAPRMLKTNIGDIMTTNMVDENGTYNEGDVLGLMTVTTGTGTDAYKTLRLCEAADADAGISMRWVVGKVYTMPDGQPGLKIQRII
jgi:hypothetical protein